MMTRERIEKAIESLGVACGELRNCRKEATPLEQVIITPLVVKCIDLRAECYRLTSAIDDSAKPTGS